MTHLNTWQERDRRGFQRVRHEAVVRVAERLHVVRMTDPAIAVGQADPLVMAHFPGFLQEPSWGSGEDFHDDLAAEYPERRLVSISADGYNKHGTPLSLRDIFRTFEEMGRDRLHLLHQLAGDDEVVLAGVSKGTRKIIEIVRQNADQQLINHRYSFPHSPAAMEKGRVLKDMGLRFPAHILLASICEGMHHPRYALHALHAPRLRSAAAYACDVLNLMQPTSDEELVPLAAGNNKVGVLAGAGDPLRQASLWGRLQQAYPDNVRIEKTPGHGHASSLNSATAAYLIHKMELGFRTASTTS